jgi:hypothetical protein
MWSRPLHVLGNDGIDEISRIVQDGGVPRGREGGSAP